MADTMQRRRIHSSGGALVNSQGRKTLEGSFRFTSPGRAAGSALPAHCRPCGANPVFALLARVLRPWLLTNAPPGLNGTHVRKARAGFTLLELTVAVAIIAMLVVI